MTLEATPIDDRPTIAAPDDDPYLWLEEIDGARALAFVDQQSRRTLQRFANGGFAADRDTLAAIYDRPDNIPFIGRRGGLVYNIWKDANNPRGIWRRTTFDEFRRPEPKWDILLDVDKLAAAFQKAISSPEIKSKLATQGVETFYLGQKDFVAYIGEDQKRMSDLIKSANIKGE